MEKKYLRLKYYCCSFSKFWQTLQKNSTQPALKVSGRWTIIITTHYKLTTCFVSHSGSDRGKKNILLCSWPLLLCYSQPDSLQLNGLFLRQQSVTKLIITMMFFSPIKCSLHTLSPGPLSARPPVNCLLRAAYYSLWALAKKIIVCDDPKIIGVASSLFFTLARAYTPIYCVWFSLINIISILGSSFPSCFSYNLQPNCCDGWSNGTIMWVCLLSFTASVLYRFFDYILLYTASPSVNKSREPQGKQGQRTRRPRYSIFPPLRWHGI